MTFGRKQIFNIESVTQCYTNCLLESFNMVRKGRIHTDLAMRQVNLFMPPSIKDGWLHGLETCRNHGKSIRSISFFTLFLRSLLLIFA